MIKKNLETSYQLPRLTLERYIERDYSRVCSGSDTTSRFC